MSYLNDMHKAIVKAQAEERAKEEALKQRKWSAFINPQPVRDYAQVVADMTEEEKAEQDAWWDEMMSK